MDTAASLANYLVPCAVLISEIITVICIWNLLIVYNQYGSLSLIGTNDIGVGNQDITKNQNL